MVSLTTSVLLLCAIASGGNQYDSFYPNSANLSMFQTLPTLVGIGNDDHTYFFSNEFEMSCKLWYDDEGNYRLDTFLLTVYSDCYEVDNGVYTWLRNATLDYAPSWSFTQNSYAQELSNVKFRVFVDDDGTYSILTYFNNSIVESTESVAPAFSNNYTLDITLDTSSFFTEIESYIGVPFSGITDTDYQKGYSDGWHDAENQNSTAVTIFSGILNVGLLPVNFFLSILNFEVFGINIGGFVTGLLSIAIVVIIVRFIFGSK